MKDLFCKINTSISYCSLQNTKPEDLQESMNSKMSGQVIDKARNWQVLYVIG